MFGNSRVYSYRCRKTITTTAVRNYFQVNVLGIPVLMLSGKADKCIIIMPHYSVTNAVNIHLVVHI